jgi:membrane-associated phospholipid phosphatase
MPDPNAPPAFTPARLAASIAAGGLALALAHALDPLAYDAIVSNKAERSDLWRLLRSMGYLPLWVGVAAIFVFDDGRRLRAHRPAHLVNRWSRGTILLASAALAGLAAEAVKLISRRRRPPEDGWAAWPNDVTAWYAFDWPAAEPLSSSGIGFVSSHTAVAFGAALALCALHPRYRLVWLALAAGCALQRIADRAHYLSDTVGAALVALAVFAAVWRAHWAVLRRSHARGNTRAAGPRPNTKANTEGTPR